MRQPQALPYALCEQACAGWASAIAADSATIVEVAGGGFDPCGLKVYLHATGMDHLCHAAGFDDRCRPDDGGIATIVASWFGRGVVMEERVGKRVGSVKRGRQEATPQAPEAKMALHGARRTAEFYVFLPFCRHVGRVLAPLGWLLGVTVGAPMA